MGRELNQDPHTQGSHWNFSPLSMSSNLRYIIFSVYCFSGTNSQMELLLKLEGLFTLSELVLSDHCREMAMVSRPMDSGPLLCEVTYAKFEKISSPVSKEHHSYIGLQTQKSCWSHWLNLPTTFSWPRPNCQNSIIACTFSACCPRVMVLILIINMLGFIITMEMTSQSCLWRII